jgi:hypothetical protein
MLFCHCLLAVLQLPTQQERPHPTGRYSTSIVIEYCELVHMRVHAIRYEAGVAGMLVHCIAHNVVQLILLYITKNTAVVSQRK